MGIKSTIFIILSFFTDLEQARDLMNQNRFEEALPILETIQGDEALFYKGMAQAGMLKNKEAIETLTLFYNSPFDQERLKVTAFAQIQYLQSIKSDSIHDIGQRMQFSERKLGLQQTDQSTQTEQDNIVKMLDKMIQQAEKSENASPPSKQEDKQSTPTKNETKNKGGNSKIFNKNVTVSKNFTGDQSPWDVLRNRSRDPANTAIKDKLPTRYRELVERFNEAVNN